jgi:hypothetical protein
VVPGSTDATLDVKSPAALMATSTLPFVSALEQNENGWDVTENGDRPTVIHANWPGSNRRPS